LEDGHEGLPYATFGAVVSSETLRSVIEAGRAGKRLDELSTARVIAKVANQVHAAQQKAGAGKAVGPLSPVRVAIARSGEVSIDLADGPPALGYSAPEQLSGAGDRKSDVFSLGVLLWEALTNHLLLDAFI
jgi:serine/threonine protein kinase